MRACSRLTAWCGMTIWHFSASRPIVWAPSLSVIVLLEETPSGDFSSMSDGMGGVRGMATRSGLRCPEERDKFLTDVTDLPPETQGIGGVPTEVPRRA